MSWTGVAEPGIEAVALCLVSGDGGVVVGPVEFAAVRFWASIAIDAAEHERRRAEGVAALSEPDALAAHLVTGRWAALRLQGVWFMSATRTDRCSGRRCWPATHPARCWSTIVTASKFSR